MGYIQHDAVIAVVYEESEVNAFLASWRESLADSGFEQYVLGPVVGVNGYTTWVFTPDGSKEGRDASEHADFLRWQFTQIVGASRSDFIHVRFGGDFGIEFGPTVIDSDRVGVGVPAR
jgi:hypothetical protein